MSDIWMGIVAWAVLIIFTIWLYMMVYWMWSLCMMNKEVPKFKQNPQESNNDERVCISSSHNIGSGRGTRIPRYPKRMKTACGQQESLNEHQGVHQ